jgi:hypothetical protein
VTERLRPGRTFATQINLREALKEGRIEQLLIEAEMRGVGPAERDAVERVLNSLFGKQRPADRALHPRGPGGGEA